MNVLIIRDDDLSGASNAIVAEVHSLEQRSAELVEISISLQRHSDQLRLKAREISKQLALCDKRSDEVSSRATSELRLSNRCSRLWQAAA